MNAAIIGYGEEGLPNITYLQIQEIADLPNQVRQQMAVLENLKYKEFERRIPHRRSPELKRQQSACEEIVKVLLRCRINLREEYREYGQFLRLACLDGIEPVVKMLISEG